MRCGCEQFIGSPGGAKAPRGWELDPRHAEDGGAPGEAGAQGLSARVGAQPVNK